MLKTVTLFTRKSCSLCDKAKAVLDVVRATHPFELRVIDLDVDASSETRAAYDHEVPVIELDGRKVMKFRVDAERLVRLLGPEGDPDEGTDQS